MGVIQILVLVPVLVCTEGTAAAQIFEQDDAHAHHRLQIRETQHVVTKAAQLWYAASGIVISSLQHAQFRATSAGQLLLRQGSIVLSLYVLRPQMNSFQM